MGLGSEEKIKLTFLRLFDNPLLKISYFLKNFLHEMTVWGYLQKLNRDLGLAFGAHFLHDFLIKMLFI